MSKLSKLGSEVEIILKNENLQSVILDMGEIFLDNILKEGIIKDLPLGNTITSFFKASATINDQIFGNKLLVFLNGVKDTSSYERERLINKLNESEKYSIKVGEKLLYLIEKAEDTNKANLISAFFKALVKEFITYEEFLRSILILDNYIYYDLKDLKKYYDKVKKDPNNIGTFGVTSISVNKQNIPEELQKLLNVGIFKFDYFLDEEPNSVSPTTLGLKVLTILKLHFEGKIDKI